MLCVPALPVTDASEHLVAVPRSEYWLLQASAPSSLAWHWTGGFNPVVMIDRVHIVLLAALWVALSGFTGGAVLRFDALIQGLGLWQKRCLAILVGHSLLAGLYFMFGSCFGTRSPWGFLIFVTGFNLLLWRLQVVSNKSFVFPMIQVPNGSDLLSSLKTADNSLSHSVFRRLIGVLFLCIVWLASIQTYGATIPTVDQDVRTSDWWLIHHSFKDNGIRFYSENMDANAPAGLSMPSLFFASVAYPLYSTEAGNVTESVASRKQLHQCLLSAAVAGKLVNALLCLFGVAFLGLYIKHRHGLLPSCVIAFLLLSTPGIAELTRFGRTEALLGAQCIVLIILWGYSNPTKHNHGQGMCRIRNSPAWWFMVAGTFISGYGCAILIGLPSFLLVLFEELRTRSHPSSPRLESQNRSEHGKVVKACLLVLAIAIGVFPYVRNTLAWGDPIVPWTRVALHSMGLGPLDNESAMWKTRFQVPSETVWEQVSLTRETGADSVDLGAVTSRSPYRYENILDGLNRLTWDSNVHGLLLIPFALLGVLVSRFGTGTRDRSRQPTDLSNGRGVQGSFDGVLMLSIMWAGFWILGWWLFSRRLERDWVGVFFLICFPAAWYVRWMMDRAWPIFLGGTLAVAIGWSVLVIPTWPTSDNRILMSIQSLDSTQVRTSTTGSESDQPERGSNIQANFIETLNSLIELEDKIDSRSRLLLVGSRDDFGILCDCIPFSMFDGNSQWPQSERGLKEWFDTIRLQEVTHVAFIWPEIIEFDQAYGQVREESYREIIAQGLSLDLLDPIVLEMDSSRAQLFRVKHE